MAWLDKAPERLVAVALKLADKSVLDAPVVDKGLVIVTVRGTVTNEVSLIVVVVSILALALPLRVFEIVIISVWVT